MFEHTYRTMNEKLTPDRGLQNAALDRMAARREELSGAGCDKRRKGGPARAGRVCAIALASLLAVCLSLTAVAAAVPEFSRFLQSLLPRYGKYLQPVAPENQTEPGPASVPMETGAGPASAAGEQEGVRLEVLAAASDLDTAAVYFTLTDPAGRLSGTARIEGSLELDGKSVPFSSLPVDYDPESFTATYCQRVTQPGGIDGAAASLTVTAILGGEQRSAVTLDLGSLELDPAPGTLSYALPFQDDLLAQAYAYRYETLVQDGSMKFLEPREGQPVSPETDGLLLTGAAYVGQRLHLQFRLPEYWKSGVYSVGGQCSDPDFVPGESYNTHPFDLPFTLKNGIVTDVYDGPVETDNDGQTYHLRLGSEYLEIVDRIPQWALSSWTWDLVFITYETAVQGPWTQSFTLNSASTDVVEITEPFTVEVGTMYQPDDPSNDPDAGFPSTYAPSTFDRVRVTPFAVTVSRPAAEEDQLPQIDGILKRFAPDTSKLEITIETPDGDQECTLDRKGYTVTPDEDGRMTARYLLSRPIDPQEAVSLTINGVKVPLS